MEKDTVIFLLQMATAFLIGMGIARIAGADEVWPHYKVEEGVKGYDAEETPLPPGPPIGKLVPKVCYNGYNDCLLTLTHEVLKGVGMCGHEVKTLDDYYSCLEKGVTALENVKPSCEMVLRRCTYSVIQESLEE